jgi:hypothetical protein
MRREQGGLPLSQRVCPIFRRHLLQIPEPESDYLQYNCNLHLVQYPLFYKFLIQRSLLICTHFTLNEHLFHYSEQPEHTQHMRR